MFATPYVNPSDRSTRILQWTFPKPHSNFVLTGCSKSAWHTSFTIPQLDILLDAGLCVNDLRPKNIFITHGHNDHLLLTPAFVANQSHPPDIYCPAPIKRFLNDFILADTMLNLGGLVDTNDDDAVQKGLLPPDNDRLAEVTRDDRVRTQSELAFLNTHTTHGVKHGDVISLPRHDDITVTVFDCDHTVPCVGYLFSRISHRLLPEYRSLPGREIAALRKSGKPMTQPHAKHLFAFLGDTTAATLTAEPEWLQEGVAVVITECSFLVEEHRVHAERTKHTIWGDLDKVVRRWPETTFVLMHFSMRYSNREIVEFFKGIEDCPRNIVVWADERE